MPTALLRPFHWAFLIRDPHFSIPSYYRCTIPPLDSVTGFREFYPSEAGYDELRRMFDYLRSIRHIGPVDLNGVAHPNPVSVEQDKTGTSGPSDDICVIDADDLLDYPEPVIQRFCSSVGLNYTPEMLNWNSEMNHERAAGAFEKWKGFHEDAINSTCLKPREHVRPLSLISYILLPAYLTSSRKRIQKQKSNLITSGKKNTEKMEPRPSVRLLTRT